MKRSVLPRTPFKRHLPVLADGERELRQAWLRFQPTCEITGVAPRCFGALHVHEPWTRARGGSTSDPRNFATVCDFHNEWLSQTAGGIAYGYSHNLLVHAAQGEAWIAAGGRLPGMSLDDVMRLIGARE